MSVQFGKCNLDGRPIDPQELEEIRPILTPYGPDGEGYITDGNVGIVYRAFHTTKESRKEDQPHVSGSGTVVTWDGRIDNREELVQLLGHTISPEPTDLQIVSAAYERWGTNCFAKLVGDWAVSVWNPRDQTLTLAKDFLGTRHLYYRVERAQVTWCTILDPLVLFSENTFPLCEEYLAGWLSFFPATHLTAYSGIHSVPPSSFALISSRKQTIRKYWGFDPESVVTCKSDAEYEEQFRFVFANAVRRRLRSDAPILAELSGGIDSSSIVCMADVIAGRESAGTRIDTISFYNDAEPNWNERPYFTLIEQKRGRAGCHIDVSQEKSFLSSAECNGFASTPAGVAGRSSPLSNRIAPCINTQGNRVVLSGIGGDEVAGGVPTPLPQLRDLLSRGDFRSFAHQVKVWALYRRQPWVHLVLETVLGFLPLAIAGVPKEKRPAPWLNEAFIKRNRQALQGYPTRTRLLGPLPSFQENMFALNALQRQLECAVLSPDLPHEKRYPFLDRDLLQFLFAIPREQLVRAGQRRSLMRRALVGIVPDEILNRKRKAYVVRSWMRAVSAEDKCITELTRQMVTGSLGIVDSARLVEVLQKAKRNQEIPLVRLLRTLGVELWLRNLQYHALIGGTS